MLSQVNSENIHISETLKIDSSNFFIREYIDYSKQDLRPKDDWFLSKQLIAALRNICNNKNQRLCTIQIIPKHNKIVSDIEFDSFVDSQKQSHIQDGWTNLGDKKMHMIYKNKGLMVEVQFLGMQQEQQTKVVQTLSLTKKIINEKQKYETVKVKKPLINDMVKHQQQRFNFM